MSIQILGAGQANVNWTGMMLRFDEGNGIEIQASRTYASALSLDTLPPQILQPGLLTIDYFSAAPLWKAVGFYRIESPNNPDQPQPRFDDFVVYLPDNDADGDAVPDLVELENGVTQVQTTGFFENQGRMDQVTAIWNRAASSKDGQCVIQFSGTTNPGDPNAFFIARYTNAFSITALNGSYQFGAGLSHTTGWVAVARSDPGFSFESGSTDAIFTRTEPDHLLLQPGKLSYYGGLQHGYEAKTVFNRSGTSYSGVVVITNGPLGSLDGRFQTWLWRMHSLDDQDQDGIPDLSDDAAPFPPELHAVLTTDSFQLRLSGEDGVTYSLENSTNLVFGNLVKTPVTAPASLSIPRAPSGAQFWRARYP